MYRQQTNVTDTEKSKKEKGAFVKYIYGLANPR